MDVDQKENPYYQLKTYVEPELKELNEIILKVAESRIELVPRIINHLTQSGGKRIRPLLTLACSKLISGKNSAIVKLAASVEFIHTATLFHDDVIDESELRRGRPTANSIWGNKASILIGDFLLSHAFKLMVESKSFEALDLLASTSITITEAEVWQLDLIGKIDNNKDNYFQLIHGKTAILFAAACAVAGIVNEANPDLTEALYNYGLNLGILFQITDDMMDYNARQETFGKKIGGDFIEKKMTLPLIILLSSAEPSDKDIIINNFKSSAPDLSIILNLMDHYQISTEIEVYVRKYYKQAIQALAILPTNEIHRLLTQLLNYIISRVD